MNLPFLSPLSRFTAVLVACALLGAATAHASFHLMQIEQVVGGVDGDSSAQAIQLRMRASGQSFLHSDAGGSEGPAGLVAYDANGANPVTLITFPNDVANGRIGDRVLIVSPSFAGHVAGGVNPDFTMAVVIPPSYLAAGRLDYVDGHGDVLWSLAFGGARYTGPLAPADFNGSFGAAFADSLPSDGTEALQFGGSATASSANNSTDYKLTAPGAVFTNNAGAAFALPSSTPELPTVSLATIRPETSESGGPAGLMRVSRTGDTGAALEVKYKVGGTAAPGIQYVALSNKIVIPAGKASAKLKVVPIDDGIANGTTKVTVTLLPGSGYVLSSAVKGKVKIDDGN